MGAWWRTTATGKRVRTEAGKRHEYERYQSSEKAKKDRASRNSARRSALKSGLVRVGDSKVIDHRNSNPRDNSPSNLRVMSRSANAGRIEDSRKRGSKRRKRGRGY